MDGLAVELVYEYGLLVQASTRGDGEIGEDVTQNLRTIEAIPLQLSSPAVIPGLTRNPSSESANGSRVVARDDRGAGIPKKLIIRGECFLTTKEFERINKEQVAQGEKELQNTTNF
jgi:DNA ligase (NAD+)